MRKFLVAIALLFGLYFVISRFAQLQEIINTLQRGTPRWLLLAIAVQGAWLLNVAASFRAIYRLLGIEEQIGHLLQVAAAANFVNVVTPSMGMGGMAVFVVDGKRRALPSGRVSTAVAMYVVYDYLGFLIVLALGLFILFRHQQLRTAEIGAAAIFLVVSIVLGSLVFAGMRSEGQLERLLTRMGSWVNRLLHPLLRRPYLDLERAHEFAHDVADGLKEARRSREGLLLPAGLALSNKALLVAILFLMFLAFGQGFTVPALIAGFSMGYLFLIVSPTPSGVGFVEGAMTLTLNSMDVPLAPAAIISLAYRGITFWLPLAYGMFAFRWVGQRASTAD